VTVAGPQTSTASGASGRLRPRARLVHTIGSELISSPSVALVELVKNAYDADATRVLVRLIPPLKSGSGAVEVLDNGTGMSSDTLLRTWLDIATPNRRQTIRTAGLNRRVLGEKGIGRFAASRLGDEMTIISRPAGGASEVTLILDWGAFRDEEAYLDEMEILWEEHSAREITRSGGISHLWDLVDEPPAERGTLVRLQALTSDWTRDDVAGLRRDLARLVSPQALGDPTDQFAIYLVAPDEFDDLTGLVAAPEIIRQPPYRLEGRVQADGKPALSLTIRGVPGEQHLESFGSPLEVPRSTDGSIACGPLRLELRIWDRERSALAEQATEGQTGKDVAALLDQAAGVSVYRDGFRLLPYGEIGDDWLGLDRRRVQNPTLRVSNNQIIGAVYIDSSLNPELRDQTNREGLTTGPPYEALVGVVQAVLAELEIRRRQARRAERPSRVQRRDRSLFQRLALDDVVALVRDRHPEDRELLEQLDARRREADEDVTRVKETLAQFSSLALIGRLVDDIVHDGQAASGRIRNNATLALQQSDRDPKQRLETIKNQAVLLAALFKRVAPFGGRARGRPRQVSMLQLIQESVEVLDKRIRDAGADVEITGDDTSVTLDPVEVQQVVVNLVDNALHWVAHVDGPRKVRVSRRRRARQGARAG
jgi:signal transduction histidine kinase